MFTQMLFEAYMGWSTAQLLLHRDDTINQSDLLKFHWAVEDLKQYRPIQHIIGYTDFCECRIAVSPDVLIPRPETEEIVVRATELLNDSGANVQEGNFLDLCTGSGCISIALAKQFPKAKVYAVDFPSRRACHNKSLQPFQACAQPPPRSSEIHSNQDSCGPGSSHPLMLISSASSETGSSPQARFTGTCLPSAIP